MRISAFVDGNNNRYSVFVDDWQCAPKEVNMTQRTYTGWTAFVYQLLDALQFLFLIVQFSVGDFAVHSLQPREGYREYGDFQ